MRIGDLMKESGVQFGTSGARGLADAMTDWVCYAYTGGFLRYLQSRGILNAGQEVGIAGDYRPSSPRIMVACARAVADMGCRPLNCGQIPSPAVAAFGIANALPTLMVTGSHIPDDRNGIKFNLPIGEILKRDEDGIREQEVVHPAGLFGSDGWFSPGVGCALPSVDSSAYRAYVARYLDFFPPGSLKGRCVGVYEHSSVCRDAFVDVLSGLGAEVKRLGRSEVFLPVDTEAIRPEDVALARDWAASGDFHAIVSADGDGDRPLVSDERGVWLRGDIAGILCARQIRAQAVVTPVSSNTAVEKSGLFQSVRRTRIGSPFVIEGMQVAIGEALAPVVGYEANGGFLLGTDIECDGRVLPALPTRDAVLVAVAILLASVEQGKPISVLTGDLPQRFTHSDRLKEFPTEISQTRLAGFSTGDQAADLAAIETVFGEVVGPVGTVDRTDGLRITFENGEIAHLRPSGNAPELRAYTEASDVTRAVELNRICMGILAGWRG